MKIALTFQLECNLSTTNHPTVCFKVTNLQIERKLGLSSSESKERFNVISSHLCVQSQVLVNQPTLASHLALPHNQYTTLGTSTKLHLPPHLSLSSKDPVRTVQLTTCQVVRSVHLKQAKSANGSLPQAPKKVQRRKNLRLDKFNLLNRHSHSHNHSLHRPTCPKILLLPTNRTLSRRPLRQHTTSLPSKSKQPNLSLLLKWQNLRLPRATNRQAASHSSRVPRLIHSQNDHHPKLQPTIAELAWAWASATRQPPRNHSLFHRRFLKLRRQTLREAAAMTLQTNMIQQATILKMTTVTTMNSSDSHDK